jgi:hypothetical protein
MDTALVYVILLSHSLRAVSTILLEEMKLGVFGLVLLPRFETERAEETLLMTVQDVCTSSRGNPVAQLRALHKWALGRIQLLRGGADIEGCRDADVLLSVPLQPSDATEISAVISRAEMRFAQFHGEVESLLSVWRKDTRAVGDSRRANIVYEKDFSLLQRVSSRSSRAKQPAAAEMISPVEVMTVSAEPEAIDQSFVLTSGPITSRLVERGLIEEARNEILLRHKAKMEEVERRTAIVTWRAERLNTLSCCRQKLSELMQTEESIWKGVTTSSPPVVTVAASSPADAIAPLAVVPIAS